MADKDVNTNVHCCVTSLQLFCRINSTWRACTRDQTSRPYMHCPCWLVCETVTLRIPGISPIGAGRLIKPRAGRTRGKRRNGRNRAGVGARRAPVVFSFHQRSSYCTSDYPQSLTSHLLCPPSSCVPLNGYPPTSPPTTTARPDTRTPCARANEAPPHDAEQKQIEFHGPQVRHCTGCR